MAGPAPEQHPPPTARPDAAPRLWPPERPYDPLPLHRLEVPAPGVLPFAIGSFDAIGPLSRAGFPHRHTFHEIVYVTGGDGSHVVDLASWPLRPPQLCVIVPGQVHHWRRVSGPHGWVVLFDEDFLLDHPGDRDALRVLGERSSFRPDAAAADGLAALFREMEREFRARPAGFASVLQALLHVLVVRAGRLPRDAAEPSAAAGDSGAGGGAVGGAGTGGAGTGGAASLARQFARLLAGPGAAARSVAGCAARLGVTDGHLNEAVKAATGRTPGQLIRQVRTMEAKRLLAGTALTVGQVGREVGFDDPAYFCRFFRRETGTSPGGFRRAAHGNHHDRRLQSIEPADERA